MAKYVQDSTIDLALDGIRSCADKVHICEGVPENYADISSHSKGSSAINSSDFTITDGDVSGRKLRFLGKTITPGADGTIDTLVFVDESESAIKAITSISSKSVYTGVDVDVAQFDLWEIRDPA